MINSEEMVCELCDDATIGEADHDISPKHIKNKILYEYSENSKKFTGNRKGVVVTCDVTSTYATLKKCCDPKIMISVKPNEVIEFSFEVSNETNKDVILVVGIQMAHSKLKFMMNEHGMEFGGKPYALNPKKSVPREISVTFTSHDVGQYEMPVLFIFKKSNTDENIIIIREMVVFVESLQSKHETEISPYANKHIHAARLVRSPLAFYQPDLFRIPKRYKSVYANALVLKPNYTQEDLEIVEDIREVLIAGITEDNYIRFFHNLLWYEETIIRINLKKYNMSGVPLLKDGSGYILKVPGLAEKRPSLMQGDLLFIRPNDDENIMFEAIINKVEDNIAHITGLNYEFESYYDAANLFDIRFFMSRMCMERMHRAVNQVLQMSQKCRIFPRKNKKTPKVEPITTFYNPQIANNREQRTAVEHILSGSSGRAPYVVHGPPGTGKTITIVEAILQIVKKIPAARVLVCTDSNMAADHVALMLIKYHKQFNNSDTFLLRANSQFRMWETLPAALVPFSNGFSFISFYSVNNKHLSKYKIVVTTLSHSAKYSVTDEEHPITHLFIDEAAQSSEPACLIPATGLLKRNGQMVLAGDPKQLGPVIISHDARRKGLGTSLMERLKDNFHVYDDEINDPNYTVMLRNNFRNHPDILELPNELFYKGQLRAHAPIDPLSSTDILMERSASRAIVFHGVRSKEQKVGKSPSFFNTMELEIVKDYIRTLIIRHHVKPDDIGVVSPYLRQVYKVKLWLKESGFENKVEVGTVEAFQGKEKRIIIISTVRANCSLLDHDAKFQLGFLVDDKRFNVALTRAKAKVIVIGNPLCLEKDIKWHLYIEKCREYGTYFGFDADIERNEVVQNQLVNTLGTILKDIAIDRTNKKKKKVLRKVFNKN